MLKMPVLDTTDLNYGPGFTYPLLADAVGSVQNKTASYAINNGPVVYFRLGGLSNFTSLNWIAMFTRRCCSPGGTRYLSLDLVSANLSSTFHPTDPLSRRHLLQRRNALPGLELSHAAVAASPRVLFSSIPVVFKIGNYTLLPRDGLTLTGSPFYADQSYPVLPLSSPPPSQIRTDGTSYRVLLR